MPCTAQHRGQQFGTSHQLGDTIKQAGCLMHGDEELFIHIPHKVFCALKRTKNIETVWQGVINQENTVTLTQAAAHLMKDQMSIDSLTVPCGL